MAISKEQQSAYQRWEMASFGDERPSTLARRAAEQPEEKTTQQVRVLVEDW